MVPQQKLLRIIKLISLLKSPHRKTIHELAKVLETGWRTLYRYLELLEEAGFVIEKDFEGRYFIPVWEDREYSFSEEEASVLQGLIQQLKGNPLKETLLSKVFIQSDLHGAASQIYNAGVAQTISRLTEAIRDRKQVILHNYHSANSSVISDRRVEPIALTENMQTLMAYEIKTQTTKFFKLERVGETEVTEIRFKHADRHEKPETDAFGMSEKPVIHIKIRLGMRASLLLQEEFPAITPCISIQKEGNLLEADVNGFKGIGRFLAGIMEDISMIEPPELSQYLEKYFEIHLDRLKNFRKG